MTGAEDIMTAPALAAEMIAARRLSGTVEGGDGGSLRIGRTAAA
jgi:hypothetical protein